jgi:uncharacterized membrane protein YgdD (TMEM256/DUF423 family)
MGAYPTLLWGIAFGAYAMRGLDYAIATAWTRTGLSYAGVHFLDLFGGACHRARFGLAHCGLCLLVGAKVELFATLSRSVCFIRAITLSRV